MSGFAVMVLAAGASSRMGQGNKLTRPYSDKPLIDHVIDLVDRLDFSQRIVVVGGQHQEDTAKGLRRRRGWLHVLNAQAAEGVGSSIAAGAGVLNADKGVFICFADMPGLHCSDFEQVAALWGDRASICRPVFDGRPEHPVLFGRQHYSALRALRGHVGASGLMGEGTITYSSSNPGVVTDFDVPTDFSPSKIESNSCTVAGANVR